MTYLQFLGLFTVPPILVLLLLLRGRVARATWRLAALLALIAFLYTAPWDNLIVVNNVWSYSRRQVLGLIIGVIPLEEYLFYVLQVVATVLFCVLIGRWSMVDGRWRADGGQRRGRVSRDGKGLSTMRQALVKSRRGLPARSNADASIDHRPSTID